MKKKSQTETEAKIERKVALFCRLKGVPFIKIKGSKGYPDRLLLINRRAIFIEFKSKTGRLSAIQKSRINSLKKLCYEVEIHDNSKRAIESIKKKMDSQRIPKKRNKILPKE